MDSVIHRLDGRIALVTGASSGIGHSLCLALARGGARVAAAARRAGQLDALVAAIAEAGGQAVAVPMDVADEVSVKAGYDAAEAALGPVDTIYNIAGINAPGPLATLDVAAFDAVMATNVRGSLLVTREGCNRMIASGIAASGRGRAIIMSSITGLKPYPGAFAYSISKAAAIMLGTTLAIEYPDINVNTICPGSMLTEINRDFYAGDTGKAKVQTHLRRRMMDVADIEDLLLYLGCDSSRAVTGSVFKIDDGQTL